MVKTVTLTADTPQKVTFEGAYPYYWIDNKTTADVYASVGGIPEADKDDTYTITAGSQLRISGGVGNDGITLLGEGKVQIIASTIAACPFKSAPAVGGGGGSDTVDEFLSITSPNPVQNKAIKAELDKKANSKHSHNVADITDFPDIPDKNTVIDWGFYVKATSGIPKTDLAADVQASLDKANTALQQHQSLAEYIKNDDERLTNARPANGGNAETVNGHTVGADVPSVAKFTDTVYIHPTTPGNKHIPSGGSSGQILRWSADGTAVWGDEISDTDYQMQCGTVTVVQSTSSAGLDITFPKKFKSVPLIFLSGSPPSASTSRKYPIIATFSELTAEGFKLTSWVTSSSGLTSLNQNVTGEVNWAAFGEIEEDENG